MKRELIGCSFTLLVFAVWIYMMACTAAVTLGVL